MRLSFTHSARRVFFKPLEENFNKLENTLQIRIKHEIVSNTQNEFVNRKTEEPKIY